MTIVLVVVALLLILYGIKSLTAAYKTRINTIQQTGLAGINDFCDFVDGIQGTVYNKYTTGGANVIQGGTGGSPGTVRSTLVRLHTSSPGDIASIIGFDPNNGSNACMYTATGLVASVATDLTFNTTVGAAGDNFVFGLIEDQFSGSRGSYFKVDLTISPNWILVRNAGTLSQQVTSIPVDFTTNDFTRLKVVHTTTTSLFYINAVLVGTISITQAANFYLAPVANLTSVTQISIPSVWLDYVWFIVQLPSPRLAP